MSLIKTPYLLFIYGEGGHCAQMNRLAPNLLEKLNGFQAITLSDDKKSPAWAESHYLTSEFRNKHKRLAILSNLGPLNIFLSVSKLVLKYNIKIIITTGPGMAIPAALVAKLLRVEIIHIETWSRFSTYSLSGRIMYHLADKFYVQNESLLKLYPEAIYSGRL